MTPVFALATNITTALGMHTANHWQAAIRGTSGIREHEDAALSKQPFFASMLAPDQWQYIHAQTAGRETLSPFEQMALFSARQALQDSPLELNTADTVFILSSTKGNIEWLGTVPDERIALSHSAGVISKQLGLTHPPVVISQACISGVVALLYAQRLLQSGRYKHAIVTGADRFTRFVLNGFQSFHAIDKQPCRPFDADRKGINLGEAAATIILSTDDSEGALATLLSGATSNDANHISGPSRTGEELAMAITRAMEIAGVQASDIDMLSAHGTATVYNDEMEANAFHVAGVSQVPTHSYKGFTGHTLGAAGVLESAMIIEAIREQHLIPTLGFENMGVTQPINITTAMQPARIRNVLKTASGFGGSNAAMVWGGL